MNWASFCRNLKQDSLTNETSSRNMAQRYGFKVNSYKGSSWGFGSYDWNNRNDSYGVEDSTGLGFPWPPRSYTCSFCKREFRSAQALGGHMNVHRRDRARLRQYSPPSEICGDCNDDNSCNSTKGVVSSLNLNDVEPKPNPSVSSNPISYHRKSPTFASLLPISSQFKKQGGDNDVSDEGFKLSTKDLIETKTVASKGLMKHGNFNSENACEERDFVRLDLEIGLISHDNQFKEELDLELRLGYIRQV